MGSGFKDFASGAILTAGDVDNYLMRQTVMTFASASARDTALSAVLDEGMVAYLEDTDTVTVYDGSTWNAIGGGGKILQIVRATDTTQRTTTSTSFVDASISVTITPTAATSDVLLIWSSSAQPTGGTTFTYQEQIITDNSNNVISGAQEMEIGASGSTDTYHSAVLIAFDSPATTSATTYKGRFLAGTGVQARLRNEKSTGQLFAIEVGA